MIHLILFLSVAFAVLAVVLRKTLFSVFSLAIVSVFLSVSFFTQGAPVAGVFELSVGAGLITVLIVLTLTFIQKRKEETAKISYIWIALSVIVCALIVFFFYKLIASPAGDISSVQLDWKDAGQVIWKQRVADLFPQALIILAAVFGILVLLRKKEITK